ncbi:MAG TPA: class III poly(R)-hydroxyalkanoic acid synthase subunit PhaE [Nitrospiraceae bacterium]|nr:class III poly(R)-hydroxyalkanoic acid synthase subunit PhaE [Nitrospiraceae bacterium]
MVKVLTEVQKQMWDSWFGLLRAAPSAMPVSPGVVDQWRELATQALKGWTTEAEQVTKDMSQRLVMTQDCVLRFLELSLSTWNAVAPKIEGGEDWQAVLTKYTDQLRQQFVLSPQGMTKTTQDSAELWRLYVEEWQKLFQPWAESLQRAPWRVGQASTGDGSALVELMNLYGDAYERTFGRLIESPSLGHTRELNEDLLRGFAAWMDYRQASFEYQVELGQTWTQAFEEFTRNLISQAEKGEAVQSLRQLLFQWIDVIDQVFAKLFRSDEYIRLQGHLLNTAMTYRLREREIVEAFLKTSHVPYRSEMDEAHRRIYHLRKEVKELKKALQDIKAELSSRAKSEPAGG